MIRIVCPYCHTPLSSAQLESASCNGQPCLVCPECDNLLLTADASSQEQGNDASAAEQQAGAGA